MDEWRPNSDIREAAVGSLTNGPSAPASVGVGRKRKRGAGATSSASASGSTSQAASRSESVDGVAIAVNGTPLRDDVSMTEEEIDIREHRKITERRNFDKVNFGTWQIKTWYVSGLHPLQYRRSVSG